MNNILLEVEHLIKYFNIGKRRTIHAVDGINFSIAKGTTLGLVGESGCGKSTVGRTILRLLDNTPGKMYGRIIFNNHYVMDGKGMRAKAEIDALRKDMQMVYQDPYSSLNPRLSAGSTVGEPLDIYKIGNKAERMQKVADLFRDVGLEDYHMKRFPHEFSGGQRQRIGIARALALEPKLIVADEPIAALDVSIQAQIINLFKELQENRGLSYLFISHDLNIVENLCDNIAVMYLGKIVEYGKKSFIYNKPLHPYTKALLDATPIADPTQKRVRLKLKGKVPSPINPPNGCRFHTRCAYVKEVCRKHEPKEVSGNGRTICCHHPLA